MAISNLHLNNLSLAFTHTALLVINIHCRRPSGQVNVGTFVPRLFVTGHLTLLHPCIVTTICLKMTLDALNIR